MFNFSTVGIKVEYTRAWVGFDDMFQGTQITIHDLVSNQGVTLGTLHRQLFFLQSFIMMQFSKRCRSYNFALKLIVKLGLAGIIAVSGKGAILTDQKNRVAANMDQHIECQAGDRSACPCGAFFFHGGFAIL